jgi:hypothetical protein
MGMISVCDGCGRQQPAACYHGNWQKPYLWFERTPIDPKTNQQERTIIACSPDCIELAEAKRGAEGKETNTVVLPL